DSKTYDGNRTTAAYLSDDRVAGDDLTDSYASALFNTKNVGTSKTVTVDGLSINGIDAANYSFNTTTTTTADITLRSLTISATADSKTYDGSRAATTHLADDRVVGDDLSDSYASARFDTKNVGTSKSVTVAGLNVAGSDAANYTFNTTTTATADITVRSLTI